MSLCVAVFETTHETLRAEDYFRARGVRFRPVLKPRGVGSACRMALQFAEDDLAAAHAACAVGGLALKGFYRKTGGGWELLG